MRLLQRKTKKTAGNPAVFYLISWMAARLKLEYCFNYRVLFFIALLF